MTTCSNHSNVPDQRGVFTGRLPIPRCESGAEYMVWNDNDGGPMTSFDCAMQAANFAAEILTEDTDDVEELSIRRQCHDHEGQPDNGCPECGAEYDEGEEEGDDES